MFPKNDEFKIQGYTEIINFEPTEIIELENLRPWVTKVYFGRYFSNVVRQNMKQNILKRVIMAKQAAVGVLDILIKFSLM